MRDDYMRRQLYVYGPLYVTLSYFIVSLSKDEVFVICSTHVCVCVQATLDH
jgi:hypothetical protein